MGRINMAQFVIALAMAATVLLHGTVADDIVVGGPVGWTIPPSSSFYSTWASTTTFKVGDTLVFNFPTGAHDVSVVTKQAYDACNTGNPINRITNGPARVPLNTTGEQYFICEFPGHCAAGQKLSINVVADSGSDPAPAPSDNSGSAPGPAGTGTGTGTDTPSTQAPPPSNAASSRGVGFAVLLMFTAVGLLS